VDFQYFFEFLIILAFWVGIGAWSFGNVKEFIQKDPDRSLFKLFLSFIFLVGMFMETHFAYFDNEWICPECETKQNVRKYFLTKTLFVCTECKFEFQPKFFSERHKYRN